MGIIMFDAKLSDVSISLFASKVIPNAMGKNGNNKNVYDEGNCKGDCGFDEKVLVGFSYLVLFRVVDSSRLFEKTCIDYLFSSVR